MPSDDEVWRSLVDRDEPPRDEPAPLDPRITGETTERLLDAAVAVLAATRSVLELAESRLEERRSHRPAPRSPAPAPRTSGPDRRAHEEIKLSY
jgi:hypothetical protein